MKPGQILSTGLLFFLLFMPLFAIIGDLRLKCEIVDKAGCGDYVLMQGLISSGLLFGLILSVGGAYKMRTLALANKVEFGKGLWFAHEGNLDDSDLSGESELAQPTSFIQEHNITPDTYQSIAAELDKQKTTAESQIQHLLQQLNSQSGSTSEMDTMKENQAELEQRVAQIEHAKKQMRHEMEELRNSGEESSFQLQDSVVGGDLTVNEPEAIARAAIEAYRIAKNDDK
jgi:hypothetical protein